MNSISESRIPFWGRIETLWLVAAPLCALLYTLCLPIAPNDFWNQARFGWYIETFRTIPTTNIFAAGVPENAPFVYQAWLAQWVLYRVLELGLAWVVVFRAVCIALAIGLVTGAAYRRLRAAQIADSPSAKWAALAGIAALVMASNNLDIRPQTFSIVFFALTVCVVWLWPLWDASKRWKMGGWSVFLFVVWANTHGAFATGLGILGLTGIGALFGKKRDFSLLALALMCGLATLINPRGWGLYTYLFQLTSLPISQKYIAEWQPPSWNEWHSAFFLLSPLLPVILSGVARIRRGVWSTISWGEWATAAALFLLGCRNQRAILWFALWLAPLLALAGAAALWLQKAEKTRPVPPRAVQIVNAVLLAFLLASALPFLPWFKPALPFPSEFRARFAPTPARLFPHQPDLLIEKTTPVAAVEFLARTPSQKALFCEMVAGSYITWALYPDVKPYAEPRIELYPPQFWENYQRLSGGPPDAVDWLETHGFSDALLDKELQPGLVERLQNASDWKLESQNRSFYLFRRQP